jgi:hypothetical protein
MDEVFICYKTDTHHSYASRDIIGIGTTRSNAVKLCKQQALKEGEGLSRYSVDFLWDKLQTQDYEGEGEFVIELVDVNVIL